MAVDASTQKDSSRYSYDAATMRACWLVMLNQGGWWTSKELRQEMKLHPELVDDAVMPNRIAGSLSHAAKYGLMTCRNAANDQGPNQYAVMPDNSVPRGIAIKHIVR